MKKLIFIASILFSFFSCSNSPEKFPDFTTDKGKEDFARKAFTISQDFVKQNLKSPSTADFPLLDYSWSEPDIANNSVIIKSYVDAQNAFGGMLRQTFYAKVKYKSGDWADINNWTLIELKFVNQ